jgi:hypothetical protein
MLNVQQVGAWQTIRVPLSDGDPGVDETIGYIRQLVDEGLCDPRVRRVATEIIRGAGVLPYDELGEVRAIFEWARNWRNVRFFKDMVGKEMLQPAWSILESGAGDCDCINAILLPSLLGAVGYATRAVTIAADPSDPDNFSHIYIEALVDDGSATGAWIPLDVARPGAAWGKMPEHFWRIRRWPLMEAAEVASQNIGRGGSRTAPTYLNGVAARPRVGVPLMRIRVGRLMPRFGLGQDDGGSGLDILPSGSSQPILSTLAPVTMPQNYAPVTGSPVVSSTGPSSSYVSSSGPSLAQQLTPILQAVPGIETGVATIVRAANAPAAATLPVVPGAQSGTAVATLSTGGSSLFTIGLILLAAIAAMKMFKQ